MHEGCACNELIGITNRVLGETPPPKEEAIRAMRKEIDRMSDRVRQLKPLKLSEVVETFTGAKRALYQRAYESLQVDPLTRDDARIKAFVKAEKLNPGAKVNPDPRMIQARNPRYNLVIAKYLRPIEHYIYALRGPSKLRQVAKGLNQVDRATLLKQKFARFADPVCLSLDASRFDKHVSEPVLRLEHRFYTNLMPNEPELNLLLNYQISNKCRSRNGFKYICKGGRMSGDINTALGNCLIMVAMTRTNMRRLSDQIGEKIGYELMDDGDDCLVVTERCHLPHVIGGLPKLFLDCGFVLKVEGVTDNMRQVDFCQSRMAIGAGGDIMVRDWRKVLSHACVGVKQWLDPKCVRGMIGLVGECELALSAGVPILQEFALALSRIAGGQKLHERNLVGTGYEYRLRMEQQRYTSPVEITDEARLAFEEAFDTPIWEQLHVEQYLRTWDPDLTVREVGVELDHRWEDLTCDSMPELY